MLTSNLQLKTMQSLKRPMRNKNKADAALSAMDRSGEEAEFQTLVLASLNLQQDPVIAASYAALGEKPGAVGYDERERLVERQADGSLQPL